MYIPEFAPNLINIQILQSNVSFLYVKSFILTTFSFLEWMIYYMKLTGNWISAAEEIEIFLFQNILRDFENHFSDH